MKEQMLSTRSDQTSFSRNKLSYLIRSTILSQQAPSHLQGLWIFWTITWKLVVVHTSALLHLMRKSPVNSYPKNFPKSYPPWAVIYFFDKSDEITSV